MLLTILAADHQALRRTLHLQLPVMIVAEELLATLPLVAVGAYGPKHLLTGVRGQERQTGQVSADA